VKLLLLANLFQGCTAHVFEAYRTLELALVICLVVRGKVAAEEDIQEVGD
jgi:hypothetical protein